MHRCLKVLGQRVTF